MVSKDPFSGLNLSAQAQPGKLDQRLFNSGPPSPPPTADPVVPTKIEPPKKPAEPAASPAKPSSIASIQKPPRATTPRFDRKLDLKDEPLYKASYLYTQEELEMLEDLKLELRREYDTKVTKNQLIRSALHMLLEDHSANGRRSYASRKIKGH